MIIDILKKEYIENEDIEKILSRADAILYKSKKTCRNKISYI